MLTLNGTNCGKPLKPVGTNEGKNPQDVTMGNPQAPDLANIGWLAGIIDGEGYLGLRLHKDYRGYDYVRPEMHICNTDEQIILKARDILLQHCQVNAYVRLQKIGKGSKQKQVYRLQTRDMHKMKRILDVVHPYLTGNKLERTTYILEFCNSRIQGFSPGKRHPYTKRELELLEKCQPLMRRGASETIRSADRKRSQIAAEQAKREQSYNESCVVECQNPNCKNMFRSYHNQKFCSKPCYWQALRGTRYASRSEDIVQPCVRA